MTIKRPTIPPNAYPLATREGRAIPIDVYRPAKTFYANNGTYALPDQINVIEVQVASPLVVLRDNALLLMEDKPVPDGIDMEAEELEGCVRLLEGSHVLVAGPSVTVAGHCWINVRTLWQAAAPTNNWRAD